MTRKGLGQTNSYLSAAVIGTPVKLHFISTKSFFECSNASLWKSHCSLETFLQSPQLLQQASTLSHSFPMQSSFNKVRVRSLRFSILQSHLCNIFVKRCSVIFTSTAKTLLLTAIFLEETTCSVFRGLQSQFSMVCLNLHYSALQTSRILRYLIVASPRMSQPWKSIKMQFLLSSMKSKQNLVLPPKFFHIAVYHLPFLIPYSSTVIKKYL